MKSMELMDLMRSRYSARGFSPDQVADVEMEQILEAGRIAPSAINRQPWRFLAIRDSEGLAKVDECSPCRYGASAAVLVCFDIDESAKSEVVPDYGWVDCGLAIMQMSLMAKSIGIDSCIVGKYDPEKARELFNIPENVVPYQFVMLGHSCVEPGPFHASRRPVDEVVVNEAF